MNSENPDSFQNFSVAESALNSADGARLILKEVLDYSMKVFRSLSKEIKAESSSMILEQLGRATERLDNLAEALRGAAGKLREKNSFVLAKSLEIGSQKVMRLSNNFRTSDSERVLSELQDFARQQPGIFLGASVLTGFFIAQLVFSFGKQKSDAEGFGSKGAVIGYSPMEEERNFYERH